VIGTFMDCIHNMPEEIQEDKGRDLIGLGVDILLEKDLQEELKGLFIRDVHTEEKIMRLIEKAETYANNYKLRIGVFSMSVFCAGCDGKLQDGERFIEENGELYCEVCYREN